MGLVTALTMFVEEDEEAEMAWYREMAQRVVDSLIEVPGLNITLEHDGVDYLLPNAVLRLGGDWSRPFGPRGRGRAAARRPAHLPPATPRPG